MKISEKARVKAILNQAMNKMDNEEYLSALHSIDDAHEIILCYLAPTLKKNKIKRRLLNER